MARDTIIKFTRCKPILVHPAASVVMSDDGGCHGSSTAFSFLRDLVTIQRQPQKLPNQPLLIAQASWDVRTRRDRYTHEQGAEIIVKLLSSLGCERGVLKARRDEPPLGREERCRYHQAPEFVVEC